jgi:hypothetical protein
MDLNEIREELSKSINDFLLSYGIEPVYLFTLVFGLFLYLSIGDIRKDDSDHFDWIFFMFSIFGFLMGSIFSLIRVFE